MSKKEIIAETIETLIQQVESDPQSEAAKKYRKRFYEIIKMPELNPDKK